MNKSNLDVVFTDYALAKFGSVFRKKYKEDRGKDFKGNLLLGITLDVLNEKGFPDVEDIIRLIILGKGYEDDAEKRAYAFLEQVKQREEYKERGELGIFCDLCRDAHIDKNMHKDILKVIDYSEKQIVERLNSMCKKNAFNDMVENLKLLSENIKAVENKQETAKADTVE